jgi:MFS transporter, FSR family, fosmidomycin resistance protein
VISTLVILMMLIFSKYFHLSSISRYYTFYLMKIFGISGQNAQIHLLIFLFAVTVGTFIGGHPGDRPGQKYVILGSILSVAPFTLLLPHASLYWTGILTIIIGVILALASSAILVYAQALIPGKMGMVFGLLFGFSFGMGGINAAVPEYVADLTSIGLVYQICEFLPLLGVFTALLPNIEDK